VFAFVYVFNLMVNLNNKCQNGHPGSNRARRRVTTLIETNALPLS